MKLHQTFIIFLVFCFGLKAGAAPGAKKAHVLPAHLQKAYTLQKDSIIYSRPDFDSLRITSIPAGTKVTISKKLYRPKTNFGTFYRIYISRPKKLRAYISEIDVVPHYIQAGRGWQLNPAFKQVKKKLNRVRQFSANQTEPNGPLDLSAADLSQMRMIGLTVNRFWIRYSSEPAAVPSWFFNIKLTGPGLPISKVTTDFNLGVSFTPPVINQQKMKKGYVVIGDFLLKFPLLEAPHFLFNLGAGLMVKAKGARPPEPTDLFQIIMGTMGAGHLLVRLQDRLSFSLEGKSYYDFQEKKFSYGLGAGVLVAF